MAELVYIPNINDPFGSVGTYTFEAVSTTQSFVVANNKTIITGPTLSTSTVFSISANSDLRAGSELYIIAGASATASITIDGAYGATAISLTPNKKGNASFIYDGSNFYITSPIVIR